MLPAVDNIVVDFNIEELPSRTFKLQVQDGRVKGFRDGIEAVRQAIYLILNVERYKYPIYSWNYGIELEDLFGKSVYYVEVELERRIKEALMQDSRIKNVYDFSYERLGKEALSCRFSVDTIFGVVEAEKVVSL